MRSPLVFGDLKAYALEPRTASRGRTRVGFCSLRGNLLGCYGHSRTGA